MTVTCVASNNILNVGHGRSNVEASTLGWTPGVYTDEIHVVGVPGMQPTVYRYQNYFLVGKVPDQEFGGWVYISANDQLTLTVFND